jgi:hypothetical protein
MRVACEDTLVGVFLNEEIGKCVLPILGLPIVKSMP